MTATSTSTSPSSPSTIIIESPDIIRLLLAHLTCQGLHETAHCLRQESGIGFLSKSVINAKSIPEQIRQGEWGIISQALSLQQSYDEIQLRIQEQIILELAEEEENASGNTNASNMELAYSVFRIFRDDLDTILEEEDNDDDGENDKDNDTKKKSSSNNNNNTNNDRISVARSLEQKLAALVADPIKYKDIRERQKLLYTSFGQHSSSLSLSSKSSVSFYRQERRNRLAMKFEQQQYKTIDLNRLPTLLQQAIQWQSHTGQLPFIKEIINNDNDNNDDDNDDNQQQQQQHKKKKRKKRKVFDILLGTNDAIENAAVVGEEELLNDDNYNEEEDEPIPESVYHKIKFGKSAVCETAIWMPDNHNNLITGSSDGLIEIWRGNELNIQEYSYQDESVMGHSQGASVLSLTLSNDSQILVSGDSMGCIKVWKVSSGKCLRQYQVFDNDAPVTCLALSRDASRLLTGSSASGNVKEFGLVSQTILQEYVGHSSYIHSCQYIILSDHDTPFVVTSSADGTVRIWQKGQCRRILQPPSSSFTSETTSTTSLIVSQTQLLSESPAIPTVISCPRGKPNELLFIPRSCKAYLVDFLNGTVLQTFTADDTATTIFCAACSTPTWLYIATQTGDCLVFSISKGTLQRTIRDFAMNSTYSSSSSSSSKSGSNHHQPAELTQLLAHPFKPILAALSNDKTQKRGVLTVWK